MYGSSRQPGGLQHVSAYLSALEAQSVSLYGVESAAKEGRAGSGLPSFRRAAQPLLRRLFRGGEAPFSSDYLIVTGTTDTMHGVPTESGHCLSVRSQ